MNIKDTYHVQNIKKEECKEWFLRKHYAHRIPSVSFCYGLYLENVLCGICSFGTPIARNMNEIIEGFRTVELNRLILNDHDERNITSFFVSQSLKLLPSPLIVVSYADPQNGHYGFIYQATNFMYTGQTQADREFVKNGRQYHRKTLTGIIGNQKLDNAIANGFDVVETQPKYRYLYFLGSKKQKKEMLAKLPFDILPYPKGENKRYDASYEVKTQLALL